MPAVSSRSFTPYGMPCSGPRYFPAAISRSACLRLRERDVARERDDRTQLGVVALDAVEVDLRQALRRELARLDPARELRDRTRRRCRRRSLAAAPGSSARTKRSAFGVGSPATSGVQRVAGASVGSSAIFRGPVRRSSSAAIDVRQLCRRHRRAAPASSSPASASPLRRRSPARPRGRPVARC